MGTRPPNDSIPFTGVAADPQDGTLSGASLVWTSSLRSTPIGTGATFDATLEAGTQVITLTATDSDSNVGTDSITLYNLERYPGGPHAEIARSLLAE